MGNPVHQLTAYQFGLLAGTFVLANLAAFWYLRRHFFSKRKGLTNLKLLQVFNFYIFMIFKQFCHLMNGVNLS